jgi:hypothetical protein
MSLALHLLKSSGHDPHALLYATLAAAYAVAYRTARSGCHASPLTYLVIASTYLALCVLQCVEWVGQ